MVQIDTNCYVDEDAYFDSVSYRELYKWFEEGYALDPSI